MALPIINKKNISKILHEQRKNIAIITHTNPDGDAIGSSFGLCKILKNLGHSVNVISPDPLPDFLKWLPGVKDIIVVNDNKKDAERVLMDADIIFALDFNNISRINDLEDTFMQSTAKKILIDHHPNPENFAHSIYSYPKASSTAELIYTFCLENRLIRYIDNEAATCIFTGIMADTGCFSYNSSEINTYKIVAELLGYSINKDKIFYNLYDNFSENRMKLLGFALSNKMQVFPEFNTAIMVLNKEELQKFNFQIGDTEGFVNYPLSIKGILFSALIIERDKYIKLSFRSKGSFRVNKFANKHFNGGGHSNAAGGESHLNLNRTVKKFIELLSDYKNELVKNDSSKIK